MRTFSQCSHRGTTRESKGSGFNHSVSTEFEKLRRHKNKKRIWRRAAKRLALELSLLETAPLAT